MCSTLTSRREIHAGGSRGPLRIIKVALIGQNAE